MLPAAVLNLLQCPACRQGELFDTDVSLVCSACQTVYPVRHGIPALIPPGWEQSAEGHWGNEDMEYWERAYEGQTFPEGRRVGLRWENTILPCEDYLFRRLRGALRPEERRTILDVGCGTAEAMRELLPPVPDGVYVGTDLSLNGLRGAMQRVQYATFLQAATQALPFRPRAFDVLLVLGSMHHLPNPAEATRRLVDEHLRPGGTLLLYEGIERPLPLPRSIVMRLMPEESEHEHRIVEQQLIGELSTICQIEHVQKDYTPLRTAMVLALGNRLGTPRMGQLMRWLDALCAGTLGRVLPAFAGGFLYVYATRR